MGLMQFNVPLLDQFDPMVLGTTYVSGIEGVPWAGRILSTVDGFSIERAIDESGRLSIVWPNREYGASVLTTASLRCQSDPYWLPIELARGTLHRVRNRAFADTAEVCSSHILTSASLANWCKWCLGGS